MDGGSRTLTLGCPGSAKHCPDSARASQRAYATATDLIKVDKTAPNAPSMTAPNGGYTRPSGVKWYATDTTIAVASAGDPTSC